ncbi:MAG: hypothetical protein HPY44_07215 [Armatimonadetes bacterium]|nr:hypothetical protein [Armatimonadota bacterium]
MRIPVLMGALFMALAGGWAAEPAVTGPELIANGGLEELAPDGAMPAGWLGFCTADWGDCAGQARVSDQNPHQGAQCVEMSNVRTLYAVATREGVPMDPDRTYLLTAYVRTALRQGQAAFLVASWRGEKGYIALESSRRITGSKPWTRLSLLLSPATRPKGATNAQISVRVSGTSNSGRAWLDSVSLRECRPVPPEPMNTGARRRLMDMARELLVEVEVWRDRLSVLQRRRADLATLIDTGGSFDDLRSRWGNDAAKGTFLTHRQRPRSEFESSQPQSEAELLAQLDRLHELPAFREQCFRELDALLALKRQLDAHPDLRRFYLWAQLQALGAGYRAAKGPDIEIVPPAEYEQALAGALPTEGIIANPVFTAPGRAQEGTRIVAFRARLQEFEAGDQIYLGIHGPDGKPAGFGTLRPSGPDISMRVDVPSARLWFPDCPVLYEARVLLIRDGKALDFHRQMIAFRDIAVAETDVDAAGRHAWDWSLADYALTVNGQPYFMRGTVCGQARSYPEEASRVFDELWLDFQRTYGSFVGGLSVSEADDLARAGLYTMGGLAPSYAHIRSYESADEGFEEYAETCEACAWVADHPALVSLQTGNEAELEVWGADLKASYGDDLWHCFNEAHEVLRREVDPRTPVGYVRATNLSPVLPVPRDDYSGVNQYTGRYFGRRSTMTSDLGALSLGCALDNKPMGITEWYGPKYSWAGRGISGVDEGGAAQYLFDYYRAMLRAPATIHSTQFVLNWVLTPVEDLSSVPLAEGLKQRDQWRWSMSLGVPWYPNIWPDLETDTPGRRAMRGFQSPLFDLCESPGEILVASVAARADDAQRISRMLTELGRESRVAGLPDGPGLADIDANVVLLGGLGNGQPEAVRFLEDLGVIGRTDSVYPPAGGFLIQRRVHPFFPDRVLVVVTAADDAGMQAAMAKLAASAEGLGEAYARHASCGRALALVDDNDSAARAFARYVMEFATRGDFLGRDDIRLTLDDFQFAPDGSLPTEHTGLGAVIVAARRELSGREIEVLRKFARLGCNVIWSAATLANNPSVAADLGIVLGERIPLSERLPVADWAQAPLAVPDMGDAALEPLRKFGGLKPESQSWVAATTAATLQVVEGWRSVAASGQGAPVVVMRLTGEGSEWVFGADLEATADALLLTTTRGAKHSLYDRDVACGLERLFRLLANACAFQSEPRPASTPRLRATIVPDRQIYAPGRQARVRVVVRDADGNPCDASVRVSFAGGDRFQGLPGQALLWTNARRLSDGVYEVSQTINEQQLAGQAVTDVRKARHRSQSIMTIFADVVRPGTVGDWTSATVRVGEETDEAGHMQELVANLREGRMRLVFGVSDPAQWVELKGSLRAPLTLHAGQPATFTLDITQVENDTGNDWMDDAALVLTPIGGGNSVRLPLAPGKAIAGPLASVVKKRPEDCIVVSSESPARFEVTWENPRPGLWALSLAHLYSDDYHIADTDRLPREERIGQGALVVVP